MASPAGTKPKEAGWGAVGAVGIPALPSAARPGRAATRGRTPSLPLVRPAAAAGAQVEHDQAGGAVVAGRDVAIGDVVVAIDVGGVDDDAGDGRPPCHHR